MLSESPNFEKFFMVATKSSNYSEPYNERKWMGTDMQICITFNDPRIIIEDVEGFAASYQMHIAFAPAASIEGGVYILEVNPTHQLFDYYSPTLTLEIAKEMWVNHEAMIHKIAPSLRLFTPHDPDDELYSDQWWMEDDVSSTCNGTEVAPNTGIDLDCAWNYENEFSDGPSYSGEGVVVGVIDYNGVEFSHPDCEDLFLDGWIVPSESGLMGLKIYADMGDVYYVGWNEAHLQNVSGIIGANIDNGIGSAGVAYGCKIIPCLTYGTSAHFNSLLMILLGEDEITREVDIINMSFGYSGMSIEEGKGFPFHHALQLCHNTGRGGKGIVLIESAGNSNGNITSIPAAFSEVFSVAATNPNDQIKEKLDTFDPEEYTWGSSYFNYLDVAAPGICISSTDFTDGNPAFPDYEGDGYAVGNYNSFSGTSASAPIVSGIAALLLEKNTDLTNEQVYDAIRLSCDKVGGYTYSNPTASGRTLKLGFGRVNACQALDAVDMLSTDEKVESFSFIHANPIEDNLRVTINGITNYSVVLMSVTGQVIYQNSYNNEVYFEIDMQTFSSGIYYLKIIDSENNNTSTSKIIKQ